MECSVYQQWDRVVAHFDLDCFYAQVELQRRPELKDRPLGVTQKFLVVTANYAARARGVPKMASVADARTRCPEIVLIKGEDLTPYRAASKRILAVLARFGTLERLGLDEAFVDLSPRVAATLASGSFKEGFVGHVERGGAGGGANGIEREGGQENRHDWLASQANRPPMGPGEYHLAAGSWLASQARRAVEEETGYQMSCGVSHNKLLAKLVSSRHKPNDQTTLVASAAMDFIANLPVRKVPGVGRRLEEQLASRNVTQMKGLSSFALQDLQSWLGPKLAPFLFGACRGYDPTPVTPKGPLKSVSVEDSFLPIHTVAQAKPILQDLLPDLVARIDEEWEETRRRPKTFTVKWRKKEKEYRFTSASCPMPPAVLSPSTPPPLRISSLLHLASSLLSRAFPPPPPVSAATSAVAAAAAAGAGGAAVAAAAAAAAAPVAGAAATAATAAEIGLPGSREAAALLPVVVINVGATNFVSSPQPSQSGQPGSGGAGCLARWLKPRGANAGPRVVEEKDVGQMMQGCPHVSDDALCAVPAVDSGCSLVLQPGSAAAGSLERWLKPRGVHAGEVAAGEGDVEQRDAVPADERGCSQLVEQGSAAAGCLARRLKPRGVDAGPMVQGEIKKGDGIQEEVAGRDVLPAIADDKERCVESGCSQLLQPGSAAAGSLKRGLKPRGAGAGRLMVEGDLSQGDRIQEEVTRRDVLPAVKSGCSQLLQPGSGASGSLKRWLKPQGVHPGQMAPRGLMQRQAEVGRNAEMSGALAGRMEAREPARVGEGGSMECANVVPPKQCGLLVNDDAREQCSAGNLLGGLWNCGRDAKRGRDWMLGGGKGSKRFCELQDVDPGAECATACDTECATTCDTECATTCDTDCAAAHDMWTSEGTARDTWKCEECGKQILAEKVEEHLDFHFALRLEAEERRVSTSLRQTFRLKREVSRLDSNHTRSEMLRKRPKRVSANKGGTRPGAKSTDGFPKGKSSINNTLDAFVSRHALLKE
ncbi:hypothetical protein CLOP_g1852 [Closterium sp. NIES-67]|nr:hypothetical protein CLOP_g1852 [Closterium sp. NIES-67]